MIRISPMMQTGASLKYGNRSAGAQINGVAPTYLVIRNMTVEKGRAFSDSDRCCASAT